jgi:predicted transcriptional regulator
MSVSGIFSSSLSNYTTQSSQSTMQKLQQEFKQLGQDLQSIKFRCPK